jgi:hypothetical protein
MASVASTWFVEASSSSVAIKWSNAVVVAVVTGVTGAIEWSNAVFVKVGE